MRESLFDESGGEQIDSFEEKASLTSRRQFLKTIGIACVGLAVSSDHILAASSAKPESEAMIWRDRVTGFVFTVCSDSRARVINSRLAQASIVQAPSSRGFHSLFSAPFIFVGVDIDPEKVTCGNGFEVRSFPYYDVECPCRSTNDLNAIEIRSISNAGEIERFGCVLAPASQRMPMEYQDHALYRRLVSEYNLNPDDFDVGYKRVFTGRGKAHLGYQITHKTKRGPTGKSLSDFLLANSDS
jgi:hypothetical protein